MKVTLQFPDELYDAYCELATKMLPRSVSPEEVMVSHLDKFKWVMPMARVIVLQGDQREKLEAMLGGGQLSSEADLVEKVSGLAHIEIGGVRMDFSAGQMNELKNYASKNGLTVEEAVFRTVKAMQGNFFSYVQSA